MDQNQQQNGVLHAGQGELFGQALASRLRHGKANVIHQAFSDSDGGGGG